MRVKLLFPAILLAFGIIGVTFLAVVSTTQRAVEPDLMIVDNAARLVIMEKSAEPADEERAANAPASAVTIQTLGTMGAGDGTAEDLFAVGGAGGLDAKLSGVSGGANNRHEKAKKGAPASPAPVAEAPTVRAWFPESFLWQPLVDTGTSGSTTVQFTVPDTLTTWRILALGQTREGSQGGAVHTVMSTLPAYVDVAAPLKLRVGDVVDMPVQVVNQTGDPLRGSLAVVVTGGLGQGGGAVNVAAWGSSASTVRTVANHAGELQIEANLTGEREPIDAVRKTVSVTPVGRPVEQSRAGTLGGARTVSFDPVSWGPPGPQTPTPARAVPTRNTEPVPGRFASSPGDDRGALDTSIAVTVFPGALSVLRSELDYVGGRGGDVAAAAYAWRVSQSAGPLVASEEVNGDMVRDLGLVALQRLMRGTRAAGTDPAGAMTAALALAGLGHPEGSGLDARLAGRMRDLVVEAQQADGLWTLGGGYGLDEQLIASSRYLWALRQSDTAGAETTAVKGARLRFSGALERFSDRLTDPYVAAWALASGGAEGLDAATQDKLRKVVLDALVPNADGSKRLDPTLGASSVRVLRASTTEATAVALLALGGEADAALMADLATGVLGRWSPGAGFGGGWAGLTALPALAKAMGGEIPKEVKIQLYVDDQAVGEGALDPAQPHAPVRLSVPGGRTAESAQSLRIVATPAVPGLAFTAVSTSWVPWVQAPPAGLELRVTPPPLATVGVRGSLRVEISGPTGATVEVKIALPAGVDVDTGPALQNALGTATAETEEGAIQLHAITLVDGLWSADLPVTPTLAGSLQSGAAVVTLSDGETFTSLPSTWTVRR